jgi:competence protein ComEA
MGRDGGTGNEDRASGRQRLHSMQLPSAGGGWVPDAALESSAPGPDAGQPPVEPPTAAAPTLGVLVRGWLQDRLPLRTHGVLEQVSLGSVITAMSVLVGIVLVGVLLVHRHSSGGYSSSYDASVTSTGSGSSPYADPTQSAASATAADPASIVVDVGGKVRKPGLVTLPAGARVADAITAAGGPLHHREIATVDLAARVTDGQLLLVGVPASAPAGPSAGGDDAPSSSVPVDLNSATLEQLETLPGIGPVTGQKIIDWRTAHSGFTSIEQLQQVSGIGPATYADLAPLVAP